MKLCGVYQIINTTNKKIYIGSSSHLMRRWNTHKYELSRETHSNNKLQRAWNKYGVGSFVFSILEECEKDQLIKREQYYLDTLNPEYNILKIAYSSLGHTVSDEAKQKIREKAMGRTFSEETLQKMRDAKIGKPSPRKGCKLTPEQIENARITKTGQRHPNRKMGDNDKLTKEHILQIHNLSVNQNKNKHELAKLFNVSDRHIVRILTGRRQREAFYLFHGKYPD